MLMRFSPKFHAMHVNGQRYPLAQFTVKIILSLLQHAAVDAAVDGGRHQPSFLFPSTLDIGDVVGRCKFTVHISPLL